MLYFVVYFNPLSPDKADFIVLVFSHVGFTYIMNIVAGTLQWCHGV